MQKEKYFEESYKFLEQSSHKLQTLFSLKWKKGQQHKGSDMITTASILVIVMGLDC